MPLFLCKGGSILCRITGSRRYSRDLMQGGLEVPCTLVFNGVGDNISKAKQLLESALVDRPIADDEETFMLPKKKARIQFSSQKGSLVWVQLEGITLKTEDKAIIANGEKMHDLIIDMAQRLLKKQFPNLLGLQSTLLQQKKRQQGIERNNLQLQVIHSRGDHWIVASTIFADDGQVNVYDSVYHAIDKETEVIIANLFGSLSIRIVNIEKQSGGSDCGVYAIALITALAFGMDPIVLKFNQPLMRRHLIQYIEDHMLMPFPLTC